MSIGNSARLKLNSLRFARVLPSGSAIGGGIHSIFGIAIANGNSIAIGNGKGTYNVFTITNSITIGNGNGGGIYSVFNSVFGIANGNGNAKRAVFGNSLLQISSETKASG